MGNGMLTNFFKFLFVLLLAVNIVGCAYKSIPVSAIGVRVEKANFYDGKEAGIYEGDVDIYNVKRRVSWADDFFHPTYLSELYDPKHIRDRPYMIQKSVRNISFDFKDIVWDTPKPENNIYYERNGTLTIIDEGKMKKFAVKQQDGILTISHKYKEWYNYPAQSLLLFTVPFDIVVTGITSGLLIVVLGIAL